MRPTRLGSAAAALAVALLVAAYGFGYAGLAVLGLGIVSVLAAAAGAVLPRPRAELSRTVFPERVTRGEPAVGMLTVRNRSGWSGLLVQAHERCGGVRIPVRVPYLRRLATCEVGYPLPTGERGVFPVGPLEWERVDRFGLMRRRYHLAGVTRLYVHPGVHPLDLASATRSVPHDRARTDAAPEGTITFHRLREYVPGDDPRKIHWRSSARTGTLMVRQNIDVSRPRLTVLLINDRAAYPHPPAFEPAVEAAASALVAALTLGVPARLWTSDGITLGGRGGTNEARTFLDRLAEVTLTPARGLPTATDLLRQATPGGTLLILTGTTTPDDLAALRVLATRYAPAVLARFAPAAAAAHADVPPAVPGNGLVVLDTADAAAFCAHWNQMVRTWVRT